MPRILVPVYSVSGKALLGYKILGLQSDFALNNSEFYK